MNRSREPGIERLTTGISGLDTILNGGLPSGSLCIIAGAPGTGKSTLALQIACHQARLGSQTIFFITILEPAVKFLRIAQQFDFFDVELINRTLTIRDLSDLVLSPTPERAIGLLRQEIEARQPVLIVIDSFKALRERLTAQPVAPDILYNLVVELGVWGVTALLVGEYDDEDLVDVPECYAADALFHLTWTREGLRAARQIEVLKLRGSGYYPGKHFFDISAAGLTVYPRVSIPIEHEIERPLRTEVPRVPTGVPGLDEMLEGGLLARSTTVVEGGTGTGKTLISLSFLVEGARRGESGLFFTLDETREQIFEIGVARGWGLAELDRQGLLRIIYNSPIEIAGDVLFHQMAAAVQQIGAKRAVLDSLSTLEMGIAARGRFEELVYSMAKMFRAEDVTFVMTAEVPELMGSTVLTGRRVSSLADNVIRLRYVEIGSRLTRAITVVKTRGSRHSNQLHELLIAENAVRIRPAFETHRGVLTGIPTPAPGSESTVPEPDWPGPAEEGGHTEV